MSFIEKIYGKEEISLLLRSGDGEVRAFPLGWNWNFFFYSWIFGIPLFLQKLYGSALLMALILASLLVARYYAIPPTGAEADRIAAEIVTSLPQNATEDEVWTATLQHPAMIRATVSFVSQFLLMFAMIGFHLWICFRGNERVIQMHLKRGWRFASPDSETSWQKRRENKKRKGDS